MNTAERYDPDDPDHLVSDQATVPEASSNGHDQAALSREARELFNTLIAQLESQRCAAVKEASHYRYFFDKASSEREKWKKRAEAAEKERDAAISTLCAMLQYLSETHLIHAYSAWCRARQLPVYTVPPTSAGDPESQPE